MGIRQAGVLQGLTKLVAAEAAGLSDGQLLRRFAATRDDGAFAALIHRHGALVYGVCRNVLRNEHDAEDAFQATFLVLARRAGMIREGLALSGWLYRVAYRVSTKSRLAADRRRRRESQVPRPEEDRPVGDLAWRELQAMLHEELNRLPEKYRAPFVLCVLTGKSKPEAAAELGWKEGTVSSRLAMAREKLRVRLARRGVALSALLSGLAISENGAATAVPTVLVDTTRQAAVAFALGRAVAEVPAALARSVLRGMTLARLRYVGIAVAVVGVFATAAVAARPWKPAAEDPPPPEPVVAARLAPDPVGPPAAPAPPPPKALTVEGEVLGPGRQPMPNARLTVGVIPNPTVRDAVNAASFRLAPLGGGEAGGQGAFKFDVPHTSPAQYRRLTIVAKAPGYAFTSFLVPPQLQGELHGYFGAGKLTLVPGKPARAQLLDAARKPARGVTVHVVGLEREGTLGNSVGLLYYEPPVPLPDWPGPFVTDDDGVFTVPDIVPGTVVYCQPRDNRFAPQWLRFTAPRGDQANPPLLELAPATELTGRVVAHDTRRPIAGATVVVETPPTPATRTSPGTLAGYVESRTDAEGGYQVKPFPGPAVKLTVYPPAGAPYPVFAREVTWPPGADKHDADLAVPRGVLVRGTVEETGTGRRLAGAVVNYTWADRHKVGAARPAGELSVRGAITGPDGAFTLAVPPGSGHVVVKAAVPDYVPVEIAGPLLRGYGKGGPPVFPDALAALTVAAGAGPQDVTARVRRGVTLRGRVVGADGELVIAHLHSLHYRQRGIEVGDHSVQIRGGPFELPGCEPGTRVPVWVYDVTKGRAAHAILPVDPASEPEVRLAPTVGAKVRFVDPNGLAVPKPSVKVALVLRPGADEQESLSSGERAMVTVPAWQVHETHQDHIVRPNGDVVLPGLIPGATYLVGARGPGGLAGGKTFTAPADGTLDLGRVTLEAPRRGGYRVGQTFLSQPVVSDPDGDPVALSLVEGPEGMTMDPETWAIHWVPAKNQAGVHKVRIRASDPFGGTAEQEFQIRVNP